MKKYFMMVIAMTMMTIGFVSCSASDDEMGETVSRVTTDESGFSLLSYSMTAGSAVSEESNSKAENDEKLVCKVLPEEAKLAFERYGVDAVMIGRATFGRPWIFKEIRDYLDNTGAAPLTVDEKIDLLEEQLRINVERIDEYRGILHTRRHLAASPIFKGIPDFRQTRIAMLRATTVEELKEILKECRERIKAIE